MRAFILNLQFPERLENIKTQFKHTGFVSDADYLFFSGVEEVEGTWTCPRWAKIGDICFFMQTASSKARITKALAQLHEEHQDVLWKLTNSELEDSEKQRLHKLADTQRPLLSALAGSKYAYDKHGGKVFAWSIVTSEPVVFQKEHGGSSGNTANCKYGKLHILSEPIDVSDLVKVNRFGSLTEVKGEALDWLIAEIGVCDEEDQRKARASG